MNSAFELMNIYHLAAGKQVPITELDANVVAMYVEDMKSQTEELFLPFLKMCKGKKVHFFFASVDKQSMLFVKKV